jgi:hypothetical protein
VKPLQPWKSNKYYIFWVYVCSVRHLACKAHAPCFDLWRVWFYHTFPHYPTTGTTLGTNLINIEYVFCFSLKLFPETFLILTIIQEDISKNVNWCYCQILIKLVSALAFGTQVRGFKPGRSRRIFQGEKILSAPSFGMEIKPWVLCRWFTACKRSLGVSWKSASRQN